MGIHMAGEENNDVFLGCVSVPDHAKEAFYPQISQEDWQTCVNLSRNFSSTLAEKEPVATLPPTNASTNFGTVPMPQLGPIPMYKNHFSYDEETGRSVSAGAGVVLFDQSPVFIDPRDTQPDHGLQEATVGLGGKINVRF
jgi:hypothetical protein